MAITLEQAKALERGQVLYHIVDRNRDGTPRRWRVNGEPKTWKRSPERVQVPVKHGLYSFAYITERELDQFSLNNQKPIF
jgi:hypothetical protein